MTGILLVYFICAGFLVPLYNTGNSNTFQYRITRHSSVLHYYTSVLQITSFERRRPSRAAHATLGRYIICQHILDSISRRWWSNSALTCRAEIHHIAILINHYKKGNSRDFGVEVILPLVWYKFHYCVILASMLLFTSNWCDTGGILVGYLWDTGVIANMTSYWFFGQKGRSGDCKSGDGNWDGLSVGKV